MDQPNTNWRAMFERGRQDRPASGSQSVQPPARPNPVHHSYDDGFDAAQQSASPLSAQEITDEAALALAADTSEYRPWILQRGTRPVMMLHLRRYDVKSGIWQGWQLSYPHLQAVEYVGDRLLSLDFGARQFVIEGDGIGELPQHLQMGNVLTVQEFARSIWPAPSGAKPSVTAIRCLGARASSDAQ